MSTSRNDELQAELSRRQELESELAKRESEPNNKVDTFLGPMQNVTPKDILGDKKLINDMIGSATLSTPGSVFSGLRKLLPNKPLVQNALTVADKPLTGAAVGAANDPEHPILGAAVGGSIGSIPGAYSAGKSFFNITKNALQKISPTKVGRSIQNAHDVEQDSASALFNEVSDVAKDRNIGEIKLDPGFLDKIEDYFPNTRAAKQLIESAKSGLYEPLRKLQSELWHRGTSKKSSIIPSDRDVGEEMLDLRDILNDKVISHFHNNKHPDLADKLTQAKSIYKNLKDTYYSHNTISKLVDPATRKIPKNILKVLDEDSVQMKRLRSKNPFIETELKKQSSKKNAMNQLKLISKYGAGAGIAGVGLLAGVPRMYNKVVE